MSIIGLDFWGFSPFQSYSSPVRNISKLELSNAIFDEIQIRDRTDISLTSPQKEIWHMDTRLMALFQGNLEAGNVGNKGVQIEKFAIKRRRINETKDVTLGYEDFSNDKEFSFTDYTQASDRYIYSVVPVGVNGLEGQVTSIELASEFTGWFVVDKETNNVLSFDKYMGSPLSVNTKLNEGKVQIDTLYQYPTFFYTPQSYHTFNLQGLFIPEEWEKGGHKYQSMLNQFIYVRKPFLVKGGSGEMYVCNVSSPSKSSPNNTWNGHDYFNLTLEFTEIMSYEEYMNS